MIDTSDIPEAGEEFFKKAVLSYGPPIRLGDGPGGVIKVKRGGTGKISNSGNAPKLTRVSKPHGVDARSL